MAFIRPKIYKILLEHGADENSLDMFDRTPRDIARSPEQLALLHYITELI